MSKPRTELQLVLEDILGLRNVYFQPPESTRLVYPCIMYSLSSDDDRFADDTRYKNLRRYSLTVVDKNPDSQIPERIKTLPYCSFDRFYTADNLNHFAFSLYY